MKVRVRTTTRCQANLNREIKKFQREMNKEKRKEKIKRVRPITREEIYANREMRKWNREFRDKMCNVEE